ncbi:hypothetical protein [Porticoccus sp.]
MTSVVAICNQALSHLRAGGINSLDETSLQAQQCKLKYPLLRDMLLKQNDWSFAKKLVPLSLTTKDVFDWVYAYNYPSDCLQINRLVINFEQFSSVDGAYRTRHPESIYTPDTRQQVRHQVMTENGDKIIVANEPDLRIEYRARVEDPTLFPPEFVLTLAYFLAADMAMVIVGGQDGERMMKNYFTLYQNTLANAIANDRNEDYHEPLESEFITVRM